MRRLTWMRYNHMVPSQVKGPRVEQVVFHVWRKPRQPMQRTEYYMPWGVVTVDELHRMEYND